MKEDDDVNASPSRESSSDDVTTTCEVCGNPIDTGEWHPIETEWDDGDLSIHTFCSQECHDEWSDS